MATKGSFSQLLGKRKASKMFCLVASTIERAFLVEILLDISGQISKLVGSSADGSVSDLAGLGTCPNTKKKHVESVYSCAASYKKPKKPEASSVLVDLSIGLLALEDIGISGNKSMVFWGSKIRSVASSVSGFSDVENMANTIVKKTSYAKSDENDDMDNDTISDDESVFGFLSSKFVGSNELPPAKSCVMKKRSFEPIKSFALDVELSAVSGKTNSDKLIAFKKSFIKLMVLGEHQLLQNSQGLSELHLYLSLKIIVNDDLRKVNSHLDREVIVKKISVDFFRSAIESVFSKFVFVSKDSVHVALALNDKKLWVARDYYWALLYTFPVGMTAYDLSSLVNSYGEKTCFIDHNLSSYARDKCAIMCFANEAFKLTAIGSVPVYKDVNLHWAGLFLARCAKCKCFGHISKVCLVGGNSVVHHKKQAPVAYPVFFGGKTWTQIAGGASFHVFSLVPPRAGLTLSVTSLVMASDSFNNSGLTDHMAFLECSMELLSNQVSEILRNLSFVELVPISSSSCVLSSVVAPPMNPVLNSNMAVDNVIMPSPFLSSSLITGNAISDLSLSSLKILITKVGGLKSKMMALEVLISSVLSRLNFLCSGLGMNNPTKQSDIVCWHKEMNNVISIVTETKLKDKICLWIINRFDGIRVFIFGVDSGYLGSGMAIIMDVFLACHVCKVSEVPAGDINSLIVKAVNKSSFVILSSNFNEDGSHKCASFKKCFDLNMIAKTIDYVFVSSNLINALVGHNVASVVDYFDTDYVAVFVSVGLGGLLNIQLLSLHKQANKNCWKYDIKDADKSKWSTHAAVLSSVFKTAKRFLDLDVMWNVVRMVMSSVADGTFKRKWFKGYNRVFTKVSSKFHKLELLVSKLVKVSRLVSSDDFILLLDTWDRLNSSGVAEVKSFFLLGFTFDAIHSGLVKVRKLYCFSKLLKSKHAEESCVRQAIANRIESFELDKSHIIRSVLEWSFCKVVLDHLVVNGKLVLEPNLVKSGVDKIMEGWTRKCRVVSDPLNYVFNDAFSGVMGPIGSDKLFAMVSNLPDGKALSLGYAFCALESKKAWVSIIPKPYEWEDVLMNTYPIVLIKTARKVFFKILSDRISSVCSTYNVLHGDNFSVLRSMLMQLSIFAISSAYNSVGWEHLKRSLVKIKMCNRFIGFFGDIHNNQVNRVMTDFGLTDGYCVHDGLDQEKVFLSFLWHIFYDSLLCEAKRQESVCSYRLNSHFVSKLDQVKSQTGLTSFFAASAYVNDTIWVGSSQTATQHILNIASEFFRFNDIFINNNKTVAISINCQVFNSHLTVSSLPISVTKKKEPHYYLGIFLSSKGLSKSSMTKTHSDVRFFVNFVLKKVISDKQFAYLVSVVLFLIVNYRTQFSFVPINVCNKWDTMICRGLKSKSGLSYDFPTDAIYYPSLYDLKTFEQIQAKSKSASIFSVHIRVNPSDNFLAGMVHIFSGCGLFLGSSLTSAFCYWSGTPMSLVLRKPGYFKCVSSLQQYGVAFQLNSHGPISIWFELLVHFLGSVNFPSVCFLFLDVSSDVLQSYDFDVIGVNLLHVDATCLSVYMDGLLSSLGTPGIMAGAVVFFENIDLDLGVGISGLVSSTMAELQAIVLALKCIPSSCSVDLFLNSQAALDACKSKSVLACLNFRNWCWVECHHIVNVICRKNLDVNWIKVKGHSGVSDNEHADALAKAVALSNRCLPHMVSKRFLQADGTVVSDNSQHFVHNIFQSIHHSYWEVGSSFHVLIDSLHANIDWFRSSLVWHPDSHLAAGFTSAHTAGFYSYFMKALHHCLSVAICKHLYNKCYFSVVCLFCGDVKVSDHVFFCSFDAANHDHLIEAYVSAWKSCLGLSHSSSYVVVGTALCKGFVFNDWYHESASVFKDPKVAAQNIVFFVHEFCLAFQDDIWLVCAKYQAVMKKNGLILPDSSISVSISGLLVVLSAGVIRLLGIANALDTSQSFLFEYKAIIGSDIFVMKEVKKKSLSGAAVVDFFSKKKHKSGLLEESVKMVGISASDISGGTAESINENTIKSESIDMEEKYLVEKTSFQHESEEEFGGNNTKIMPKRTLGKPLGTINFSMENDDNNNILDKLLSLPPSFFLKNMVQVSIRKSFALDIDLTMVAGKFSQEKLAYVRKIFFEAMLAAAKLVNDHGVVVNTNLKCSVNNCINWAIVLKKISVGTSVEAVYKLIFWLLNSLFLSKKMARADVNKQTWNARDNYKALLYTFSMGMTAYDLCDFIDSVGEKICVINHNPVTYTCVHYATVCFDSEVNLVKAIAVIPVIKRSVKILVIHLSLVSQLRLGQFPEARKPLFQLKTSSDWQRFMKKMVGTLSVDFLRSTYSYFGSIDDSKPLFSGMNDLKKQLVNIESSLISFTEQIESDIVMKVDSSETNGGEAVMVLDSFVSPHMIKLKNMLEGLSASVLSLSACFNGLVLDDIIHWHKDMGNLISIFMESKLKGKICLWISNRFDGIRVFTFSLESGHLGASVVVVMDLSLARHVSRVSKVPGWLLFIKLLFKNKILVSILGLYTGAFSVVWFSQAGKINSFIAKATNKSSFVILNNNFNEDGSHKCASFKKCVDLGLVNSLVGGLAIKEPTWANFRGIIKTINFIFVLEINEYFDTDHKAVSMSVGLGGLLDTWLNSFRKQVNKDWWKFNFKDASEDKWNDFKNAMMANAAMFSNEFAAALRMESFKMNKDYTIKNVLECPFHKVVLDHLVVGNKLVLKPGLVKSKVDTIMESWIQKHQLVPDKEAWVLMILKPYKWEDVLINTCPIALIETAYKIFSKILSDGISLAYSTFDVLYGNNFLVLKGTTTQSPIFAIDSVIEDTLKKDRELWLVLQDMRKAYNLVGWDYFEKSLRYDIAFVEQLHNHYGIVFDWYIFKQWKRLNPHGPVLEWFKLSATFFNDVTLSSAHFMALCSVGSLNILEFSDFVSVCDCLSQVDTSVLSVYTDGFLKNLGTVNCRANTIAFFEDIGSGLGVGVLGLMSLTLVELQAIVLSLECVFLSSSVCLFSNSQSTLDVCKSELGMNLRVSWHKVKDHSGVSENEHANVIAGNASFLGWRLSPHVNEHFIVANGNLVSGNFRHFEIGSGCKFLENSLLSEVDWICFSLMWHPDLHMATGFTSWPLTNAHTYFMKALHYRLSVAIRKCLYSRFYPSVLCLYCGEVKVLDHVFSCKVDKSACCLLLDSHLLSFCTFGFSVFMALFKSFVFDSWFHKAVYVFHNSKIAGLEIVKFVCSFSMAFRDNIWLVYAKHHAYIEKHGFSAGVVKLLGVINAFGVCFGFHKSCSFFSGLSSLVSVYIAA
ncbi:hypothetical protein G9A89_008575 [Geosiphon pyriformis]|nr:hypothetical protein G9A89_008575 [Geosiphon pyriformis]